MKKPLGTSRTDVLVIVLIGAAIGIGVYAMIRLDTTGEKGSGLGKAYEYDVKGLMEIDPNLIVYEEEGPAIATGFTAAHAICVAGDARIYVAGDRAIRILAQDGGLRDEIGLSGEPRCLALADDGGIYVGFKDHVEVYDGQGKRSASWAGLGETAVLTSIAISNDDVFVADAGNRVVVRYDSGGKLVKYIGRKDKDKNIPGIVTPSPYFDLAVGRDGLLRVVNPGRHRIEAYTFDGDLEFWWGKFSSGLEGFTGCCNPVNFAILPDDSFVTCEKGLIRVKVYDGQGSFTGVVAGPKELVPGRAVRICNLPAECQVGGFDLAVDGRGRVFVLDTIKNVVRVFAKVNRGS
ncbi:MAG: NHL repeat-containing protein [Planctomycetota bacterium]|jgi:hypothetical protein